MESSTTPVEVEAASLACDLARWRDPKTGVVRIFMQRRIIKKTLTGVSTGLQMEI